MRYAVVTGASSGIGEALAKGLSRKGFALILVARREARLLELAKKLKTSAEVFTADLSKVEECERLTKFLEKFDIGVFVNNAGFGLCEAFINSSSKREMEMLDLNVRAVHLLSKWAFKKMARRGGFLMNVASVAGLTPGGPCMATYYATKAYVASLSQALFEEASMQKIPVHVSCLCPGPIDTEFNSVAHVRFSLPGMSAEFCSNYAIKKMFQGTRVIIPGAWLRFGILLGRFVPDFLYLKITGHVQRRKLER